MVLLTVLSILLVLLFAAVLVVALVKISVELEEIGGAPMTNVRSTPTTLLAKARWGLRAIEQQTAAIEPELQRLSRRLGALDAALGRLQRDLAGAGEALRRQGGAR